MFDFVFHAFQTEVVRRDGVWDYDAVRGHNNLQRLTLMQLARATDLNNYSEMAAVLQEYYGEEYAEPLRRALRMVDESVMRMLSSSP